MDVSEAASRSRVHVGLQSFPSNRSDIVTATDSQPTTLEFSPNAALNSDMMYLHDGRMDLLTTVEEYNEMVSDDIGAVEGRIVEDDELGARRCSR